MFNFFADISLNNVLVELLPFVFIVLFLIFGFIIARYSKSIPLGILTIVLLVLLVQALRDANILTSNLDELAINLEFCFVFIYGFFGSPFALLFDFGVQNISFLSSVEFLKTWGPLIVVFIIFLIGLLVCIPAKREGHVGAKVFKYIMEVVLLVGIGYLLYLAYNSVDNPLTTIVTRLF